MNSQLAFRTLLLLAFVAAATAVLVQHAPGSAASPAAQAMLMLVRN